MTQFVWNGVTTTAGQTATLAGVGTLSIAANGAYVFTPAAGYAGAVPAATYTLSDGSLTATAVLSFSLDAVNDAPSGADRTITLPEDGSHAFTAADFGFTDPNDSPANGLKAVVITTLPTQGTLTLSGAAVTAGQSVLAGQLGSLVWRPAANANGAGYTSFTFQVVDDGGTANGGVDTDPTPNTITFDVTPVNDAPTGVNDTGLTAENQVATGNVLTNDGDIDGDPLSVTQFVWGGVTTTAGQTATLAGVGTLSIAANGAYSFTPAAGYVGPVPSATYTLSDGSLTATAVLSLTLSAVNDAPSGADKTITLLEDGSYSFTAADFGFTDPNDSPANALKSVVIATLPTAGTLTLSGAAVSAGQTVLAANLGSLVYRPAANANGTGYANFTFQVVDDGGTANGGVDTDPTPNTITLNVTPVNDAPVGRNDARLFATGQQTTGNVLVNDLDVEGSALSVTQFTWNGVTTAAGGTATVAGVGTLRINASGSYTFTPVADYSGPVPPATYTLSDGSLTATAMLGFTPGTLGLVTNGDFTAGGTGWTAPFLQIESGFGAFLVTSSPTGVNFAELEGLGTGSPGNSNAIAQVITTRAGEAYIFSTDAVTRIAENTGDRVMFVAGGTTLATVTTGNSWGSYSAGFTAAAASTSIKLQSAGSVFGSYAGVDDGRGGLVDNVQVQELSVTPAGPLSAARNAQASFTGFTVATNATSDLTVTLSAANGTLTLAGTAGLTFTAGNGTANQTMTFSGSGIAISAALATLRYTGNLNFTGADTITQTVNFGGVTDTDTVSVSVLNANSSPSGADKTITMLEGSTYGFSAADFGFSDPNDSPANALKAVVITTLPANGTLTLSGVAVTAGQTVLAANLGSLEYRPWVENFGPGQGNFTFQVVDDGGTANGGSDTDPTPNTITIDLTPVNDPPHGADKTITTLQNGAYSFSAADFGFSDQYDGNVLKAVVIATLPTQGPLTLAGAAVTAGQTILAADLGSLVWRPTDGGASGYASFTFQVVDDGGTDNAGLDTDPTPNRITWQNFSPQNLVSNGDFTSGGTGWSSPVLQIESSYSPFLVPASPTGGNFAELEGLGLGTPGSTNALWQNVTTRAGETYIFSTDAVTRNGAVNVGDRISFIAGGTTLATVTTGSTWGGYSAAFTGSSNVTQIKLQSAGSVSGDYAGADDGRGGFVDNVQVQELSVTPSGPLAATKDMHADFTGFSVATNATGSLVVTLGATNGTLTLADTTGLTFTVGDGTADQTMTFSGSGVAVGAALSSLRYKGNAGFTGSDTITQTVTAGTMSGSVTDTDTVSVNVAAINGAPTGVNDVAGTAENQAVTGNVLSNDSDPEGDALSVTQFSWGSVTAVAAGGTATIAGVGTLTIAANGAFTFTPAAGYAGTVPSATYTLSDGSLTATATLSFTLSGVNDPPSGADKTITLLEDGSYGFTAADFGFTDPNDSPANALKSVVIATLPTAGTLTLSGAAVSAGQTVLAANLGSLVFSPAANANGTGYASFTFRVVDDGGTANGGVDTDPTPNTITFDVTPVNDAPVGTNDAVSAAENQAATGNVLTNDSDPEGSPLTVTQFTWNGATTTAGQTATIAGVGTLTIAANGAYTFTPAAGYVGPVPSATYTLSDGSLTATAVLSLTLSAVNKAPSGADKTITLLEDGSYSFTAADFGFTDPNNSPANALKSVVIATLPTAGTLTLSGAAVSAGQTVLAADIGSLVYRPAANANGTGYANFTFQVVDDGGTANGGVDTDPTPNTITLNVTPVNDAPRARTAPGRWRRTGPGPSKPGTSITRIPATARRTR